MKRITIFCGSSFGTNKVFEEQAYLLGKTLANQKTGIVYGGAKIGLMGTVARGALENNGEVIGVLPYFLKEKEIAHENLTRLILVNTMHERKTKMNELSDGVIALSGGYGTLEELFEMLTWAQLGLHRKPIGLLNTNGFYDPLLSMIQKMTDKGFLKKHFQEMLLSSPYINELLQKIASYKAPVTDKWIPKGKT